MFAWVAKASIKSLGKLIFSCLAAVAIFIVVLSFSATNYFQQVDDDWNSFYRGATKKSVVLGALQNALGFGGLSHNIRRYVTLRDPQVIVEIQSNLYAAAVALTALRSIGLNPAEQAAVDSIDKVLDSYAEAIAAAETRAVGGDTMEAVNNALIVDDTPAVHGLAILANELKKFRAASVGHISGAIARFSGLSIQVTGAVIFLLLGLLGLFYWVIRNRLVGPLTALTDATRKIAGGDYSTVIPVSPRRDEIGVLAKSIAVFKENAIEREALAEDRIAEKQRLEMERKQVEVNFATEMRSELEKRIKVRTQELEKSELHIRTILNGLTDGVVTIDTDGIIETINPAVERIFGYTEEELIGRNIKFLMPEPVRSEHDGHLGNFAGNGVSRVIGIERGVEGQRKSGEVFPLDIVVGSMTIDGRRMFTGIVRDITDRERAARNLAETEAQLRAALDNMSGALYLVDKDLNLQVFNDKFIEFFELPARLVHKGAPLLPLLYLRAERGEYGDGDRDALVEERVALYRENVARTITDRMKCGRVLETSWAPTLDGGIVAVATDITARTRFEEDLQTSNQALEQQAAELSALAENLETARKEAEEHHRLAEVASSAKSAFLATMSHEIRTPMNGVIGMIDLLRQTRLDSDQSVMLRTVRDSAFSLLHIINDILDFSKIEAGKLELEQIPVSIRDVVEAVTETLLSNATEKNIRLLIFVDPEIPSSVLGDQLRLRQILFNLVGNAIKFTASTPDALGRVVVHADLVSASGSGTTVRFTVGDTGIGMSKSVMEGLFKPFSQAESATTRVFGGTGLGLSICKNLVEMIDGTIEVESEEGVGSTFTVTLTFAADDTGRMKHHAPDLAGVRVLAVVKDDEARRFILRYLEHWDADVLATDDIAGLEPLAAGAAGDGKPFEIVLIGSGWDDDTRARAIDSLRRNSTSPDLRFVVLTEDRTAKKGVISGDMVLIENHPLPPSSFQRGLAVAAGRASPPIEMEDVDLGLPHDVAAPGIADAEAAGTLILVAEDNATNRDVIRRQLALLGYAAEIVADGKEALEAWPLRNYGLLLTDCHMPVMDGFELTTAIRDAELGTGRRAPIIAISANALVGEADRCLNAGMDDYISKPVELPKLQKILSKWLPKGPNNKGPDNKGPNKAAPRTPPTGGNGADKAKPQAADGPVDPSMLVTLIGDDPVVHLKLLKDFIDPSRETVEEIQQAHNSRAAKAVGNLAHKLKSSARAIGANEMADVCETLESAGRDVDWAEIDRLAPRLDVSRKDSKPRIRVFRGWRRARRR